MKNKCNKVKDTCASKNYAECIIYEGTVNDLSPLSDDCALSVEEVLDDVYNQLEEINLSELGETCLEYILDEDDKIIVKNVLLKFEEKICELSAEVESLKTRALCDLPIGECLESLDCLELPCETNIITLGDWMSAVTAKICETT